MSEVVLHSKLRQFEDELKNERELRFRHEKDLNNLRLDVYDLDAQLQESKEAKERESDANKRLKQDFADLKQRYDNLNNENDESNQTFRRRLQDQLGDLTVQVDVLSKSKAKYEKENKQFLLEVEHLRKENDSLSRAKSEANSLLREFETSEAEHLKKMHNLIEQLNDTIELKNRFDSEREILQRRNDHLEMEFVQMNSNLKRSNQDLDNARLQLENELLFRASLENKLKNAQHESSLLNDQLDNASNDLDEAKKQLHRAQDEFRSQKEKADKDLLAKSEELEDTKRKLNHKYQEAQEQLTDAQIKYSNSEKNRQRLQAEADSLLVELGKTRRLVEDALRHEKQLENDNNDLRSRLNDVAAECETALQSSRNHQAEATKQKHQSEQLQQQLEASQKEKRKVSDELDSVRNHLIDAQNRLLDSERRAKAAELERSQLQSDFDDLNDNYQSEVNRNQGLQAQVAKQKTDFDKKLSEKDHELDTTRQSHRRQLEDVQKTLADVETKYKAELLSTRKKYQVDFEELNAKYEYERRISAEAENNAKRYQQINKELSDKLIDEQQQHDAVIEQLSVVEKRASSLRGELEEAKTLYERSEKARKVQESELHDSEAKLSEALVMANRAIAERKKYEADYLELYDSVHDLKDELKNAEERARTAGATLLQRDEQIRVERQRVHELDVSRKSLEQQLNEARTLIEEANEYAHKEGRRVAAKYDAKLAAAEAERDLEQNKNQELQKEIKRMEKRSKDLVIQVEDEQSKLLSLSDSYDKLQDKLKKYRGQIEGAEGQVAMNLAKSRRLQRELEDAEERAKTMTTTFLRSSSVANDNDAAADDDDYHSSHHHYGVSNAIEEYTNAVNARSTPQRSSSIQPTYLRSTYSLTRPTNLDYYGAARSTPRSSRYRTTVDFNNDEDLLRPIRSSSSRYTPTRSYIDSSFNPGIILSKPISYYGKYQPGYMSARAAASRNRREQSAATPRIHSAQLKRALRGLSV